MSRREAFDELFIEGGLNPQTLGNGPISFSSKYDTFQAALDDSAGGHLFIDDTKVEEGIGIGSEHSGTTIQCIGENGIRQPDNPTMNIPVIHRKDGNSDHVRDITFIDLYIFNSSNNSADIDNEDTYDDQSSPNRNWSAFRWHASPLSGTGGMVRFKFIRPRIENINGFGICCRDVIHSVHVIDGNVRNTMYDAYYTRVDSNDTDPEPHIEYRGCVSKNSGRHNFSVAGDSTENSAYISGVGKNAYTSGVDIEHGNNITLDVTVRNSGQATSTTGASALHSGLYVSDPSSNVGGYIRIIDPDGYGAFLKAPPDGLTISHKETRGGESPGDAPPIILDKFDGGNLTLNSDGGGAFVSSGDSQVNDGLLRIDGVYNLSLDATIVNSQGPSIRMRGSKYNRISLTSKDPMKGSGTTYRTAHVVLAPFGGEGASANVFELLCQTTHSNVNHIVNNTNENQSAGSNYSKYSGVAYNAHETSPAIRGIQSGSDDSDLIT